MKKLLGLFAVLGIAVFSFSTIGVYAQEGSREDSAVPFELNVDAEREKQDMILGVALTNLIEQFNTEDYEGIIANASSMMTEETKQLVITKLKDKDQELLFKFTGAEVLPEEGGLVKVSGKYSLETKSVSASSSVSGLGTHFLFEQVGDELKLVSSPLFKPFSLGSGLGLGIVGMVILFILVAIFWLFMLIHAIRKPIENKTMRVLVIILASWIGAIIYYFVVKRKFVEKEGSTNLQGDHLNDLQTGPNSSI